MLKNSLDLFYQRFPTIRRKINRQWYEYISQLDVDGEMLFMNYGYNSLNTTKPTIPLEPVDEKYRYFIQLYHQVASGINLHGLNVLEVGSGRGGGASYIMRYLKPRSMVGLDITVNAINFCKNHYNIEGLSFTLGNAEMLQFADNSLDVVINVESSHCYPKVNNFFNEVKRILKPGGYFLYTDFRERDQLEQWYQQLEQLNLTMLKKEVITPNVVKSLDLDNERKQTLINQKVPKILHKPFNEFAGMRNSQLFYGAFKSGQKEYVNFIFRKETSSC